MPFRFANVYGISVINFYAILSLCYKYDSFAFLVVAQWTRARTFPAFNFRIRWQTDRTLWGNTYIVKWVAQLKRPLNWKKENDDDQKKYRRTATMHTSHSCHATFMWNSEFGCVSKIPSQFGTFAIYSLSVMRYINWNNIIISFGVRVFYSFSLSLFRARSFVLCIWRCCYRIAEKKKIRCSN